MAELVTIAGSTAVYVGGVPGLVAAGAVAGASAAVAGVRQARARRAARFRSAGGRTGTAARTGTGDRRRGRAARNRNAAVGSAGSTAGTGGGRRRAGLVGRVRAAVARRRAAAGGVRGAAGGVAGRRIPPGGRTAAVHAQRAGYGTPPVTRAVPRGARATTAGGAANTARRAAVGHRTGVNASGARSTGHGGGSSRGSANRQHKLADTVQRAQRWWDAARDVWHDAAEYRALLHDTARRAYWDAESARRHHRWVRQVVPDVPSPAATAGSVYRHVRTTTGDDRHTPVVRMLTATAWAAGTLLTAASYAAWIRHWETQERLALMAAVPGLPVADHIRTPTADTSRDLVPPVPARNPVPVRPPHPASVVEATDSTGGTPVSGLGITDLAMEQSARAARYSPDSMADFGHDLNQWPQTISHLALALATFVKKGSAEYPIHPTVMDKLTEVYQALGAAAAAATEVPAVFTRAHATDLARHQAPRPGEHLWNTPR
ncbi:hypothetical protein [Saccharothrix obliqua]|uniref:hypothetical protein n=1 Tax=Saccharothrix obliqua TaxID=2861747 RepID=UPI001C5DBD59|nr:hypothetical protein [Saccharothrix obliqua]MBW4719638.1 hypothetical protein [Saccharothrix obliqua]